MALLDVTIVNVAIPSIQTGLGTNAQTVQWVVSGYALAFGLVLVTGGRLGDARGRRIMLTIGLIGFVGASAAVGLAPDARLVVLARLVQGAAAGLLTPQSSGLIQQLFSGRERGIAFGYFGTTVGVASATGPVLGGLLIAAFGDQHGWRSIFLVNIPIGLLALFLVRRWVPRPRSSGDDRAARLDLVGSLLLGLSVLCVLLPVVEAQSGPGPIFWLLAVAPLFAGAFVWWELRVGRRGGAPLLDLDLLRTTPGYAPGLAVGTVYFTGFTGIFLLLSVFLQEAAGRSALQTGLTLTPFALAGAVSAPIAGRLVARIGRMITVYALLAMMSGLVLLVLSVPLAVQGQRWWLLLLPLLIAGFGGGAVVSPNQTLSLSAVPPRMGGAAGAALQTGQRIGSAFGAALLVTAYHVAAAGWEPLRGLQVGLLCSLAVLAAALLLAVWDARRSR
jgi:EmrB/QacA subfamily drug resistance transporter